LRVSYGGTTGWDVYDADYVNETSVGRQRFADFVGEIVSRFPDCFYCPWHMPYHGAACSSGCIDTFNSVTFPELLARVRVFNNNTVVYVPIHQHPKNYPSQPYTDQHVIYGLGHVVIGSVSWGKNPWNGDTTEIDNYINLVKDYASKYPYLEFMSVEFGGIGFVSSPVEPSRLECLRYACQRMADVNAGWMYHCISKKNPRDTLLSDIPSFTAEPNLLEILQENAHVPEPCPTDPTLITSEAKCKSCGFEWKNGKCQEPGEEPPPEPPPEPPSPQCLISFLLPLALGSIRLVSLSNLRLLRNKLSPKFATDKYHHVCKEVIKYVGT